MSNWNPQPPQGPQAGASGQTKDSVSNLVVHCLLPMAPKNQSRGRKRSRKGKDTWKKIGRLEAPMQTAEPFSLLGRIYVYVCVYYYITYVYIDLYIYIYMYNK